ncbi:MAG: hypothetical protein M1818_008055 [Claussenomyces sp. TS43310]|nr:MAG: hypothetical protein M1818_008055 [Claussenomyces sp. TS43310]
MEMAAHGPGALSRTHTAPAISMRANNMHPYPVGMGHAPRTSQLSGSTAYSSASSASLSSMASSTTFVPSAHGGGGVVATNNIINQRADASRSLYQICVNLRQRLAQVPGFDEHFNDFGDEDDGEDMDPVSSLWRCLRKGYPLMTIYNALQPEIPLEVDEATVAERNRPKSAAFKFVQACLKDLKLPAAACFVLTDLFGDDTTGFVKVTQVVNVVLDVAEHRGLLLTPEMGATQPSAAICGKMSYRDHVVKEFVDTERKYVQDLENLHELKKVIEQKGVITGDVVHDIFLNINAILDFQRRFLIKIETTNSQQESRQEWGLPFVNYEEAFSIYQPFIANQRKAALIAMREFDKISQSDHPVVVDFNTLDGFLLKPMQRLVKYPLLLKVNTFHTVVLQCSSDAMQDLRDKTGADEETKADLTAGIEAANRVLEQANAAVDRELRNEALADLCTRVDEWKGHDIDHFGDLLLHGQFTVVTGKSDIEKEVGTLMGSSSSTLFTDYLGSLIQFSIYLFERILLCCKEVNPNKAAKDKLMAGPKKEKKEKDRRDKKIMGKGKLHLKGRIFMTNVSDVVSLVKPGKYDENFRESSYTVQIWWKGDPGVENFIIRFTNEEVMKKWSNTVDQQRKECSDRGDPAGSATDSDAPNFAWMRDQVATLPNPYAQHEDDDDEEYGSASAGYASHSNLLASRSGNASSTSLRSRSATGDSQSQSLAGIARALPPRFPMGSHISPQLSLQTQNMSQATSPTQRGGDSYFSPVAESPASSRTSGTPSVYPFPRQGTPQGSWEEHNRYTAPAMARGPSRDSQQSSNSHGVNGRNPQRPSLPTTASQSAQMNAVQQRSRSYSTPDINGPQGTGRRLPNGSVPAVPGIPAHLAYDAGIPRSNSNSPNNSIPIRANTQSPGAQRERLQQQNAHHAGRPPYLQHHTTQHPTIPPVDHRTMSPPLPNAISGLGDVSMPTQLKVKVNCDGNYVTLVVAFNISFQSLIDRIDAKVGRFSNNAIARGTMRLRYQDEDGDFVTIESDDDIQIAFQDWREEQHNQIHNGQLGEIELFCASVDN